jgi:membrane protease YdiL (CAAX protease family)
MELVWTIFRTVIPGVLLGLFIGYLIRKRKEEYIEPLDPRNWEVDITGVSVLKITAVALVLVVATFFLENFIINLINTAGGDVMADSNYASETEAFSTPLFFVSIVALPVAEEWMFRMVLIEEVKRRVGKLWPAVIVSAVAFGLAHLSNPGVYLPAVLVFSFAGLVYALVYVYYGLRWAIFVHVGTNLFPFIFLPFL